MAETGPTDKPRDGVGGAKPVASSRSRLVVSPFGSAVARMLRRLPRPVDFRKGAEGLAALVREEMKSDPFSGVVYVFRAKRADRVKLVYWDGTGVCLFAKRLEDGKFRWPNLQDGVIRLSAAQLRRPAARRRSRRDEQLAARPCGYRVLAERNAVALAFCWAHVRRRFYELAAAGPAPIASEALRRIAALYQIEAEIRGRSADERRTVRQEKSRPILDDLEPWLRAKLAHISQKTKLAEAIRYALSRWAGLCRFIDDGRVEIDSNVVERTIRPIALNRKNALFAGSDGGAEHWAVIASLIETSKLNGVDPYAYLAATISAIVNGHPNARLDELLPWVYPAATALRDVA
jgi:transposase